MMGHRNQTVEEFNFDEQSWSLNGVSIGDSSDYNANGVTLNDWILIVSVFTANRVYKYSPQFECVETIQLAGVGLGHTVKHIAVYQE